MLRLRYSSYLLILFGVCWAVATGSTCYFSRGDHITAITLDTRGAWYKDMAGYSVTEIQDEDLFFHNIGHSIDSAKKADIIVLGSSLVAFAVNADVIRERLERTYGVRFYNMSFVGIFSGEFPRLIMERYDLHPALWVINADDGGGNSSFFDKNLMRYFGADARPIAASNYNRLTAFREIVRRNLRWRLEALVTHRTPELKFWRNAETGASDMRSFPGVDAKDNPPVQMSREPDCHTSPEKIANARTYIERLGAPVILTSVPNFRGCITQMREIARAVGVDAAGPPRTDYSSWDGGGHLDTRGSVDFTNDFVAALVQTGTFRSILHGTTRSEASQ